MKTTKNRIWTSGLRHKFQQISGGAVLDRLEKPSKRIFIEEPWSGAGKMAFEAPEPIQSQASPPIEEQCPSLVTYPRLFNLAPQW